MEERKMSSEFESLMALILDTLYLNNTRTEWASAS